MSTSTKCPHGNYFDAFTRTDYGTIGYCYCNGRRNGLLVEEHYPELLQAAERYVEQCTAESRSIASLSRADEASD